MKVHSLLGKLNGLGGTIELDRDNRLKVTAPKGSLTDQFFQELQDVREELVELLQHQQAVVDEVKLSIAPRQENIPLSYAQARLWFLQKASDNTTYNNTSAIRLSGILDEEALKSSINTIISRHEVLRTSFHEVDGRPVQVVCPKLVALIATEDIRGYDRESQNSYIRDAIKLEQGRNFDLGSGPLLRVKLYRLDDTEVVLVRTMHHIVTDAWSEAVFNRELRELYAAFSVGKANPLPPLRLQYADFAIWQRKRWESGALKKDLDYWRRQLEGIPARLELSVNHPYPTKRSFSAGTKTLRLSVETTNHLKTFCKAQQTTLYVTILAAFGVLLARYSGQYDLVIGSPVANRLSEELEHLIGFFVNMLVMRMKIDEKNSFLDLLSHIKETSLEAYQHQEVPFERIVEELQPERDLSRIPFINVTYAMHNGPRGEVALSGIEIRPFVDDDNKARFDLELHTWEVSEQLEFHWQYSQDAFEERAIDQMARHFFILIERILESPKKSLGTMSVLDASDRTRLLLELNATVTPVSIATVPDLFEKQVQVSPRNVALIVDGITMSYGELNNLANRLAHHLVERGLRIEDKVAICIDRSFEMVTALLAVLKAGAAYVPLDPTYPSERLRAVLKDCEPFIVLSQTSLLSVILEAQPNRLILNIHDDHLWSQGPDSDLNRQDMGHTCRNLAYVMYTSGSTGQPKGVMVEHRSIVNRIHWMHNGYGTGPDDVVLQKTPLAFDVSVWELFGPLLSGGKLVIARPGGQKDPGYIAHTIQAYGITTVHFVPSMLQVFLERVGVQECSSLANVICSGETLPAHLLRRFVELFPNVALHNLYGPTEATVDVTAWTCRTAFEGHSVPIGKPIANTQIYILNDSVDLVPIGVVGELYIGGLGVARGYLNQPELSAARFLGNPFSSDPDERMYKTGDLGRWLPDGNLEFLGRNDFQVKIRGNRVELGEIETRLAEYPGIRDCVVALREDASGDKRLIAYYSSADGKLVDPGKLQTELDLKLPKYMLPSEYIHLETFPLTPNGKLDRAALPAPTFQRECIGPVSNRMSALCQLFAEVLNISSVGPNDDFFKLGGHSLLIVALASRLRDEFDVDLPISTLFEHPTASRLMPQILMGSGGRLGLDVQPRSELLPLSFAQARLWFLHQLDQDDAQYNMVDVMRLFGRVDAAALERAINTLIERHEVLRTTFTEDGGVPTQVVHSSAEVKLPVYDLNALDRESQETYLQKAIKDFQVEGFDLDRGPLLRFALLRLAPDEHVFLRSIHHIVSDGRSEEIFNEELATLYQSCSRGENNPIPALGVQYADFAIWQRNQWKSGEMQSGVDWWKGLLSRIPDRLNLPSDRPRPARQTFLAGVVSSSVPASLTTTLRQFSQERGATLFMTLITAFGVLLSRYTGEPDVVIGSPIANRQDRKLEGLIGFFVNMLAIPVSVDGSLSFNSLLGMMRNLILEAYRFQDIPFEKLVEELRPDRSLDNSPIFQVVLEYQNAVQRSKDAHSFGDLRIEGVARELPRVRYDLELHVREHPDYVEMYWQFNTDLFDHWRIEQMAKHFLTLISEVTTHPDRCVDNISFLSKSERRHLLQNLNDIHSARSDVPLSVIFERQVSKTGGEPAVLYAGATINYQQLNERANRIAHLLINRGIGPEDIVGVALPRSLDMIVCLLGVAKAGAAYLPLDINHPRERFTFMMEDAKPSCLLTHSAAAANLPALASTIFLDDIFTLQLLSDCSGEDPTDAERIRSLTTTNTAYVIYTSGSTGVPKAVVVTHSGLPSLIQTQIGALDLASSSRVLQFASPTFDASIWEILIALTCGALLVIVPDEVRHNPELEMFIAEHHITHALIPPPLLATFRHPQPGFLPTLLVGGEACPAELANLWAPERRFINAYGPSESTVCVTLSSPLICGSGVPLGHPVTNSKVYVLDERLDPVPIGVSGELYISGFGLARGYLRRSALTAERFVANPYEASGARMYRTGDLVRRRTDGEIEFVGRVDSQVKIRGFRIELGEIETVLRQHSKVQDAIVVSRLSPAGDNALYAYVVRQIDHGATSLDSVVHVKHWQELYEATYKNSEQHISEQDFVGWRSSFTGEDIPKEEMAIWVDETVARVRSLRPRKILEIGCGTGLLLTRLGAQCDRYLGIDFSEAALIRVQSQISARSDLNHVEIRLGDANDLSFLTDASFDLVILNSVVQYFPNYSYLIKVLEDSSRVLVEGGHIFVGDVRSKPLLRAFRASVALSQTDPFTPLNLFRTNVQRAIQLEEELVLDPRFFVEVAQRCEGLGRVEAWLKEGKYQNELSQFRYDVVMTLGKSEELASPSVWLDWDENGKWCIDLRRHFDESETSIGLRNIRDGRVVQAVRTVELIDDPATTMRTVGDIVEKTRTVFGENPSNISELAQELGVGFNWSDLSTEGNYSCVFRPIWKATHPERYSENRDLTLFANVPHKSASGDDLELVLKEYLTEHLPSYMIPSAIVSLEDWPLNPNGKVDRRALPLPEWHADTTQEATNETEDVLCRLFSEILGVDRIGPTDNFFSLGGHSLLGVALVSRIRMKLSRKMLVDTLFEAPTPRELASRLLTTTLDNPYGRILALRGMGRLPPLFCFPPAGGIGWVYAGLVGSLDPDRPIFCLQSSGIIEGEHLFDNVPEIVEDFVGLMRNVQPHGPYYLTGWSFGGIVAHEAACQLQRSGEEVAFLSILDTRPVYPRSDASVEEEFSKIDSASSAIEERLNGYMQLSSKYVSEEWPSNLGVAELRNILELTKQTTKIMANTNHYSVYYGDLLLFAAEYGKLFEEGWAPYVTGKIETKQLNCKHLEVTTSGPLKVIGAAFEEFIRRSRNGV
jgi:amino acid adenylation domain-containing protein